jgi:diguanylate cyclase (GGDEF)-like protein
VHRGNLGVMADGSTAPRTRARPSASLVDGHVVSEPDPGAVRGLERAWVQRVHATGAAVGPADEEERFALLLALEAAATADAVARVRGTFAARGREQSAPRPAASLPQRRKALEHAAAAWGARVGSPTLVVEQMLLLRHLVTASPDGERIGRLVDKAMVVATGSATDELQLAAFSDPLTGCANRRAFERDLERELARCARAELDLTVVALDVDGLKAVNDTEGHAAGDRTLVLLVETLRRALRSPDGIYRLGGDEFAVVLPDTSTEDAGVVLARVQRLGAPSFSWGVASYQETGSSDPAFLLGVADEALYERRRLVRGDAIPGRRPGITSV